MLRNISEAEYLIVIKLLSIFEIDNYLLQNIKEYAVEDLDEFGSIRFISDAAIFVDGRSGPISSGILDTEPGTDQVRPFINFIIFTSQGRLSELQIYKDDGLPVSGPFDLSRIVLFPGQPSTRIPG